MEHKVKFRRMFVNVVIVILGVTCLAKIASVFGSAEALKLPDSLFGLQARWVMLIAAFSEALVVCFLLSNAADLKKLGSILWLSLIFMNYRACLWLLGVTAPCPCMGNVYAVIGLDAAMMDRIMEGVAIALLAGSAYFISDFFLARRSPSSWLRQAEPPMMPSGSGS